jgi:lambda family phage tail tape measure protein
MAAEIAPISVDTNLDAQEEKLKSITDLSRRFGQSLSDAFVKSATSGKSLDGVLQSVGKSLIGFATNLALKPLEKTITSGLDTLLSGLFSGAGSSSALSGLGGGFGGLFKSADGNVFSAGRVRPFANGGVVAAPTFFPMTSGLGLMGEAGPEAIMPLARGPDGRLGVQAGGNARPVNVTVNIAANDAESFRRSEAQVSAALARAVARGQRAL